MALQVRAVVMTGLPVNRERPTPRRVEETLHQVPLRKGRLVRLPQEALVPAQHWKGLLPWLNPQIGQGRTGSELLRRTPQRGESLSCGEERAPLERMALIGVQGA
jgi:hypothetical protein